MIASLKTGNGSWLSHEAIHSQVYFTEQGSRVSGHTLQYWLGNRGITLKQPSLPISPQNLKDNDRNVAQGPPWICTKSLAAVSAEQGTQVWARSEGRKNSIPWVINAWLKDYTLTSENPRNVRAYLQFQHSGGWGREITEFKARLNHVVNQAHSPNREGLDGFTSVIHCPSKLAQDPGFCPHCFRWHQDSRERHFLELWALREDTSQHQPSTEKPLQFSCQFFRDRQGQKRMEIDGGEVLGNTEEKRVWRENSQPVLGICIDLKPEEPMLSRLGFGV